MSALAEALTPVAQAMAQQGSAYFDPMDAVQNAIITPSFLHSVMSSLCWYADIAYTRAVRDVFWTAFKAHVDTGGVDDANEFVARMAEREFAERVTHEQGFEPSSGPTLVRQLAQLRLGWYTELNIPPAEVPTLDDLLLNEKPARVSAMSLSRLEILADALVPDDTKPENKLDIKKEIVATLVERENLQARFAHANRQRVNPVLSMISGFCERTDLDNEVQFHQLPDVTQKRLIQAVPSIVNNTILRMSRDRKMSTVEFVACSLEAKAVLKLFNGVLAQPRWMRVEA